MNLRERRVWHSSFLPPIGLPERFEGATPSGIRNGAIRTAVELYLKDFWDAAEKGLAPVLLGRAGQYKTYGAAVIARFVHFNLLPVRFVKCGTFFTELEAAFYHPNGLAPYRELTSLPFLILDDFTQVKAQSRGAELMANLLDERFSATLPTVLTGNVRGRDRMHGINIITEQYRPDFARRLLHGAGATIEPPKDGFYVTV